MVKIVNNQKMGRHKVLWLLLFLLVIGIAVGGALMFFFNRNTKKYGDTKEVFGNPLMGYAPAAWNTELSDDINLLYVDITWRELEPEEGVYAWETIAAENQFDRWREEGKHVVLRFVCDIPGDEAHMDIPDWLYEKTNQRGNVYNMEYGKGYAPDYSNKTFIEYHAKAVQAMGEYIGQDELVSYVELGSLGHWGEWHVNYQSGILMLPSESVRQQYIDPWIEAFPKAKILMRRPFNPAKENNFGLYNDMAGEPDSTARWMEWIQEGGDFSQTGEKNALSAMPDFWKTAPSGGEFTSSLSMEDMLDTNLSQTIKLIQESHTTFLGPKVAEIEYKNGYDQVLKNMGYRIAITKAKLDTVDGKKQITLDWTNRGVAPMYWDWPVYLYIEDESGVIEKEPVDLKVTELLPDTTLTTETLVDTEGLTAKDHDGKRISVGIEDPMTGQPSVRFAMDAPYENGKNILYD